MHLTKQKKQEAKQPVELLKGTMAVVILVMFALSAPYASTLSTGDASSTNVTGQNSTGHLLAGDANRTLTTSGTKPSADSKHKSGIQARAASSYLASRAANGLQLKHKAGASSGKPSALGDVVNLDTAVDSQMDLQTAAGEHKKYILVKKKPKHKKIKMEVYKPKMKYKKIKMKVPVKKMKKKKVKGYLVKKEKHHY